MIDAEEMAFCKEAAIECAKFCENICRIADRYRYNRSEIMGQAIVILMERHLETDYEEFDFEEQDDD